jgi:glutamate dehydrogenase
MAAAMDTHPLRREIVATVVANAVVNRAGISFLSRLNDETGAPIATLARAHLVARDVFDVVAVWQAIDELDLRVPAGTQNAMFLAERRLVERAARRLVQRHASLALGPTVERYRPGVTQLVDALASLVVGNPAHRLADAAAAYRAAGVPAPLAARVAAAEWVPGALDVIDVADARAEDVLTVGSVYFAVVDSLRLDWLRDRIGELPRGDRWQTEARAALRDELHDAHRAITEAVLRTTDRLTAAPERVTAWSELEAAAVKRYRDVIADIEAAGEYDLTTLAVARRALRALTGPASDP